MIELHSLSFGYLEDEPILSEFSLTVQSGSVVALTGPSGCGKSTLLYLAGLMTRPWSGKVVLDGTDVTDLSDALRSAIRRSVVGFVFQDGCLDSSRTLLDNVIEATAYSGASRRDARTRALELLEHLGVSLDPRRRPVAISGGQAQRVGICRALLPHPRILLADEPTGNLDDESAASVMDELITAAKSGMSVLIATHDPRVAARCDEEVLLGAGGRRVWTPC